MMLRHLLLPHFDPDIPFERWEPFTEAALAQTLLIVAVCAALLVLLYALHARRLKIRRPQDLFRPFTPLRWLWLSLVPAVTAAGLFHRQFAWSFPTSPVSPLSADLRLFAFAALLTLGLAYGLMCLPLVTPAQYRYRPMTPFLRTGSTGDNA